MLPCSVCLWSSDYVLFWCQGDPGNEAVSNKWNKIHTVQSLLKPAIYDDSWGEKNKNKNKQDKTKQQNMNSSTW